MPEQTTDPKIIEAERQTIRSVAGLPENEEIKLNETGWDSRVYSFNDGKYFFKFPRSTKIQGRYVYELDAIKAAASLDVPVLFQEILWQHPENAYFGYRGVPGQPLSGVVEELPLSELQNIGEKLGHFLKAFHALSLPGARRMSLNDESDQIQRWYEQNHAQLKVNFSDPEQAALHKLVYETWPAKLHELGSDPVLSHGDLHSENILYDESGSVGIIDFGDVAYYDRSKDFLELDDNKHIFSSVMQAYSINDPQLADKIAVRQDMIQIINFGYHAGKGNLEKAKEHAEIIRTML